MDANINGFTVKYYTVYNYSIANLSPNYGIFAIKLIMSL